MIRTYTREQKSLPRLCHVFFFPLLCSPEVGKVGKPRRGHPLVKFVIVVEVDKKKEDWSR